MKKLLFLLILPFALSCSKEDDNENMSIPSSIIGTWEKTYGEGGYIRFSKDGMYQSNRTHADLEVTPKAKYEVQGDLLLLYGGPSGGHIDREYVIVSVDNNAMILKDKGEVFGDRENYHYRKVK